MGISGHIAFVFDPVDEARIIDLLNGQAREGDETLILDQPQFGIVREDFNELQRILEVLATARSDFMVLKNSVIEGNRRILEIGMGCQYLFSKNEIAEIAKALSHVTSTDIDQAIDGLRMEFDSIDSEESRNHFRHLIDVMRGHMSKIAANNQALIAGMF